MGHLVLELISNVLDQFLASEATTLTVQVSGNQARVSDDGGGMPFGERIARTGEPAVEAYLTTLHAGASATGHAPHVHRHMGVGLAPVNAVCSRFSVSSCRDGMRWEQEFARGVPVGSERRVGATSDRGTAIDIVADVEVFGESVFDVDRLRAILFEDAHLYEGLVVEMNGERFVAPDGLASLLKVRFSNSPNARVGETISIRVPGDRIDLRLAFIPIPTDRPSQLPDLTPVMESWINGRFMTEGGTHLEGARDAFEALGIRPAVTLMHLIMQEPEFAGPTQGRLSAPWVRDEVSHCLRKSLG